MLFDINLVGERIDKDMKGAIVVAKSDRAHQHLQAQIKAKTAIREYWGIIYGSFFPLSTTWVGKAPTCKTAPELRTLCYLRV